MIGVIGSNGLVGSHIDFADVKLDRIECPLDNFDKTLECFKKYKFDILIHCANDTKSFPNNNTPEHFHDNTIINLNVFKAAKLSGIKKIVVLSSINAISNIGQTTYSEQDLWRGEPDENCYSDGHKNRILHILSKMYRSDEMSCIVLMLSNTYGKNSKIGNGAIPFLIDKFMFAKKNNIDLILDGDGSPTRDFVYVKDIVKVLKWVVKNYESSKPIIVSSGVNTSIKKLVKLITIYTEFEGKIVWNNDKQIGQTNKKCDNSLLNNLIPNLEFTPIEVGLSEVIKGVNHD